MLAQVLQWKADELVLMKFRFLYLGIQHFPLRRMDL